MKSLLRVLANPRVLIAAAVVGGLLAVALWPRTLTVDAATVSRGPLVITTDEEGRTRVQERFVVAAPVAGRVLRIDLDAGDPVTHGQVIARVRAEQPPLLDDRARAEAQASIDVASATSGRTGAEEERARAAVAQTQRELQRTRTLVAEQLGTTRDLESKEAELRAAQEFLNAATFAARASVSDLERARARLAPPLEASGRVVTVTAPADGVVLRRLRESESVVPAGDPLLEIGDPRRIEIVADLLSTEAVRVRPGARVMVEQWGGDRTLEAKVRRIEPSGFTKISALGVEEQRVNVVMDVVDPSGAFAALGDGYRVEVRIVIWEGQDLLKIPTSALFRVLDRWAVYVVGGGIAHQTLVELGHQTGQEAEVTAGLAEGGRVIVHPGDTIADGAHVVERPSVVRP